MEPLRDWDLWPWMVAEQAQGELGIHIYRMERAMARVTREIGERLVPVFRRTAESMRAFAKSLEAAFPEQ